MSLSIAAWMSRSDSVSSALVASSKIRMGGSLRRARAIAIRWRSPPESSTPRHHRVVTLRHPRDEVVRVGRPRRGLDVRLRGVRAPVGDVGPDRVVEEDRLLGDDAEQPPQVAHAHVTHVHAVDRDAAPGHVEEAREEIHERALARPAAPHERQHGALGHHERHAAHGRLAVGVRERHLIERHLRAKARERSCVGRIPDLDGRVQELEDALGGHEPRLRRRRELGHVLHRRVELEREPEEAHELGPRHLAAHDQTGPVPEEDHRPRRGEHLRHGRGHGAGQLRAQELPEVVTREPMEALALALLGRRGLHEPDPGERLLDVRAHLSAEVQDAAVATPQHRDERPPDRHRAGDHDERRQGELPGDEQHRRQRDHELERREDELRRLARDQRPQLLDLRGEAAQDLARANPSEEAQVEIDEMIVHLVAQVPIHALLHPRHQVRAREEEDVLQKEHEDDEHDDAADRDEGIAGQVHPAVDGRVEEPLDRAPAGRAGPVPAHEERLDERNQEDVRRGVEERVQGGRRDREREDRPVGAQVPEDARVELHRQTCRAAGGSAVRSRARGAERGTEGTRPTAWVSGSRPERSSPRG